MNRESKYTIKGNFQKLETSHVSVQIIISMYTDDKKQAIQVL
jgi:hypothetical protein